MCVLINPIVYSKKKKKTHDMKWAKFTCIMKVMSKTLNEVGHNYRFIIQINLSLFFYFFEKELSLLFDFTMSIHDIQNSVINNNKLNVFSFFFFLFLESIEFVFLYIIKIMKKFSYKIDCSLKLQSYSIK